MTTIAPSTCLDNIFPAITPTILSRFKVFRGATQLTCQFGRQAMQSGELLQFVHFAHGQIAIKTLAFLELKRLTAELYD